MARQKAGYSPARELTMPSFRLPKVICSSWLGNWIDPGTLCLSQSAVPTIQSGEHVVGRVRVIDVGKAVEHLNKHAAAKSQGWCAKYVRQAIEAGGVTILNRPEFAKDYGQKLIELGFRQITEAKYACILFEKGDVAVFQPPSGQEAGHIQMYNGNIWVSDFIQTEGIYPGPSFRKEKVDYEIFRP